MASATRLNIVLPSYSFLENPGVLAAAALRRVDDERAFPECDAGQATGLHVHVLAVQRKRSEIYVTWFELLLHDRGRARKRKRRLRDVAPRVLLDTLDEIEPFFRGGVRTYQHAVATRPIGGLYDEIFDVLDHVL